MSTEKKEYQDYQESLETRLAVLEYNFNYIKNELKRIEDRIDKLQYKS